MLLPLRLISLLFLALSINAFSITRTSGNVSSVAGSSSLRLTCSSSQHYEYCVWSHNSENCEFEWKKDHDAVKKMRCSNGLKARVQFKGNYKEKECAIELTGVRFEDAGVWSCEMEDYVWGPARGTVHKKSMRVEVMMVNKGAVEEENEDVNLIGGEDDNLEFYNDNDDASATELSPRNIIFEDDEEGEEDKTMPEVDKENVVNVTLSPETMATFHNLSAIIGDDALLVDIEEDDFEPDSSFPYGALILGVFGGLFIVFLILGAIYYRKNKKGVLESDWKERQNEKMMNEENSTAVQFTQIRTE